MFWNIAAARGLSVQSWLSFQVFSESEPNKPGFFYENGPKCIGWEAVSEPASRW
jgi:hypothetical protein